MKVVRLSVLRNGRLYPPGNISGIFLTLCMWCIMFISHLTAQHLCTFRCILDHILIITPARLDVGRPHLQVAPVSYKLLETHQMITSTRWPHATGPRISQRIQIWIIIKTSLTCVCSKTVGRLDQFSHRMQHSECQ
jgi:hypothetical protein